MKTWIETAIWTISMLSLCYSLIYGYESHKRMSDLDNRQKSIEKELHDQDNLTELEKPEPPKPIPPVPVPVPAPIPPPVKDFMDPRTNVGCIWQTNNVVTIEGCEYITWKIWFNNEDGTELYVHKSNCRRCWDRMLGLVTSVMDEKLSNVTNSSKSTIIFPDINLNEEAMVYKAVL